MIIAPQFRTPLFAGDHLRGMVPSMTKAALYLRVSLDATGEGLAVDRQRVACTAIAEARGWTIAREYVDNSVSATKGFRPEYDAMTAAYGRGEFDAILCWDLDRLTRQPRQLEDWIDAAEGRGLALVTANGEADLTTDAGRLFARIKAAVARSEVERKSARQKAANAQRAAKGLSPTAGQRATGYDHRGGLIHEEADVVRQLFARTAAGESLASLTRWLNTGVMPTRLGRPWAAGVVRNLLLNPRYCGRVVHQGQVIDGVVGQWEPIVDEDMFDVVHAILTDPARRTSTHTHRTWLGSALYRCTVCEGTMRAWAGRRYKCRSDCFSRVRDPLDEYVTETFVARLRRDDLSDLLATADGDAGTARDEAKRLHQRLASIEADYDAGLINGVRLQAASDRVRAELATVESRIAASSLGGLRTVLAAEDPGEAFLDAAVGIQASTISALATVWVYRQSRGRNTFSPESVDIQWHGTGRRLGV